MYKRFVTPADVSEWFKTDIQDFGDFWDKKLKAEQVDKLIESGELR